MGESNEWNRTYIQDAIAEGQHRALDRNGTRRPEEAGMILLQGLAQENLSKDENRLYSGW